MDRKKFIRLYAIVAVTVTLICVGLFVFFAESAWFLSGLLLLIPLEIALDHYLVKREAKKARNEPPEINYYYGSFNGDPFARVTMVENYGPYNEEVISYNMIDRSTGQLLLHEWVEKVNKISVSDPDVYAYEIEMKNGLYNVVYTDKFNSAGVKFMLEQHAKFISSFDEEGYAVVQDVNDHVTYVRYNGKKLFPALLKCKL